MFINTCSLRSLSLEHTEKGLIYLFANKAGRFPIVRMEIVVLNQVVSNLACSVYITLPYSYLAY